MKDFLSGLKGFLKGKKTYLALVGLGLTGMFYDQIASELGVELTQGLVAALAAAAGLSRYLATKDSKPS